MALRKAWAFVQKDFLEETSYRLSFALQLAGMVFSVLTFFFVSKLFGQAATPYLQSYGGDYFSFVLVGLAFSRYVGVSLQSFSAMITQAQTTGTLEALFLTETSTEIIVLGSSLYRFLWVSLSVALYLGMGVLLGADLRRANLLSGVIVLLLTVICFSAFGIFSASFVVIFKRGDPITGILRGILDVFGGTYYPIDVLPGWLQVFSYFLPITYSLRAMRHALLNGYSIVELAPDLGVLLLFTVILLPLSLLSFNYAVKRAKAEGSLSHY